MLADYAEFCRRMAVCRGCPEYRGGRVDQCLSCGCLLAVKARLAAATCPKGKW